MAEPILTVEHLIKAYGETPVLDDISFAVKPGEVIVVVGPSGCGKSTLLRCLNGLEPTQSGRVRLGSETVAYGGKNLTQLRQRIGMVFQSYELFPHMTVLDNVLLAPTKVQKRPKAEVQQEAEALLDRVGLLAKKNSYPRELSGGQKQRVAIVRALCMHPEILLFDEVTAALDPEMVRANCISWVTMIMVLPCLARSSITSSTSRTISGSRAAVTSSNRRISGCIHSARTMATRCFWPPESSRG